MFDKYIIDCSQMFHSLFLQKTREVAYSYAINMHKESISKSWHAKKISGKDWLKVFRKCNSAVSL